MKPLFQTSFRNLRSRFSRGIVLAFPLSVLAFGCLSPSENRQATKEKLEAAKVKRDEGQEKKTELGVVNVDAARRALQKDESPTTNTVIAEERLDSALVAFQSAGITPAATEILAARKAIDALLSTNLQMKVDASNHFNRLDDMLGRLEEQNRVQDDRVKSLEGKLEKIDKSNAADADTLATIKEWLWFGFLAIIGYVVFKVVWQAVEIWGVFNPAIKLGTTIVKRPARVIADGFAELVQGGENFKSRISASAELSEDQKKLIKGWFASEHQKTQDPADTSGIIRELTK